MKSIQLFYIQHGLSPFFHQISMCSMNIPDVDCPQPLYHWVTSWLPLHKFHFVPCMLGGWQLLFGALFRGPELESGTLNQSVILT
jgi:hypothetical protein